MSSISLVVGALFTRLAQSAVIDNVGLVLSLEVLYAVLNITLKVSLYSRHAILSSCSRSGLCKFRGAPHNPRAQVIATVQNVTESIFDTELFIILFVSRFILLPSTITTPDFILVFCVCITVQILNNTATFVLVSYLEEIPIEAFSVPWMPFGEFWPRWAYFWVSAMWGLMYLNPVILNVWDSSIRMRVPMK